MTRLLILRHAEAASTSTSDLDRPLTRHGRHDANRIGVFLRTHHWIPRKAYVSTAMRARETFSELCTQLHAPPKVSYEPTLYNASLNKLEALLRTIPADLDCVLLIGHNPSIAELARALATDGPGVDLAHLRRGFPPAALAVIEFDSPFGSSGAMEKGHLVRFIMPDLLPKA
ncbi:SixA phosphatase family protein [Beijerinckia indica]|uniref:Putative phosphohistidine phosphatase, SixA n=1 Tax=Beijerinckia indica subsp. indica (strain ATCC 9039 / DSM 1715 / NCIMB 8712) TaxID=395963 RepID=B2IHX6_BEII9|nr:histidine phosphatase family protein [Beijerinckia indica]ACB96019.1 putative phosphohistidine phosphatase, SixA [Beijerinckia indica subsp. indica ATCC 9039]